MKTENQKSISEEILAALWLIAGLLAWNNEIKWLAWLLFAKAALDFICSTILAVRETLEEIRNKQP